jgi:translocation protein SEC63
MGIALPKFIVTEGNGKYVLLVYGALLGVLLPYIVGKWWYGSQRYTREKVLVASASSIFREYKESLVDGGITCALSAGEEYKYLLHGAKEESGLAQIENKIFVDESGLSTKDRETLTNQGDSWRRKALALLWAYLTRVDLDDPLLNEGISLIPLSLEV